MFSELWKKCLYKRNNYIFIIFLQKKVILKKFSYYFIGEYKCNLSKKELTP